MKNKYELGAYYKDDNDNIIKLISITDFHDKHLATVYDCCIVREGKYPSLNRNPIRGYLLSAMKRCRKLNNAEIIAVAL